jgi:hypothetical protein
VKCSLVGLIIGVSLSSIIATLARHLVYNATEWIQALILLFMFLVGVVMAYGEIAKWWKARMEQLRPPPLPNLITYTRDSERRWQATHVFGVPLSHLHAIPERVRYPVQVIKEDRSKKAA